jgi:hypothetical protein
MQLAVAQNFFQNDVEKPISTLIDKHAAPLFDFSRPNEIVAEIQLNALIMVNGGLFSPKSETKYFSEIRNFYKPDAIVSQMRLQKSSNELGSILFTLS